MIARLRAALPVGGQLPEHVWHSRHVGVLVLLWIHAAAVPLYALAQGYSLPHAVAEGAIVPFVAVVAMLPGLARRTRTAIASVGLLSSSAVLVHLSGGLIEMHFHFFVMVAVVALYQDWLPFLAAIGYVFIHHGVLGAVDAASVFNHPAALNNPWKWAGVHALFIAGISVACLVTWRLNERMLAERAAAEERLREETRIVEALHEVGNTLSADLDTDRVVQAVSDSATSLADARYGAFAYSVADDPDGSYRLYASSTESIDAFAKFGLVSGANVLPSRFAGDETVRVDDLTLDARYRHVGGGGNGRGTGDESAAPAIRSYLAAPVRSRTGQVLGALLFGHPEPGWFTAVSERIVVGIASQAAMALDNARLYESELKSRATAEAASHRLAVLAEASRILTSSLEVDGVLSGLGRLVNAGVSDYCAIDVKEPDGSFRRLTFGELPPGGIPFERGAGAAGAGDEGHPVTRALRSGESLFIPGDDAEASTIVVPLAGRGGNVGVITLGARSGSGRAFSAADVPFAEELARRAVLAVENARLYAHQRSVAETLQHSLLPERLPELPGVAAAARYIAGGPGVEVGGDWYDVIQLPSGRLGVAIGDVVGRGERAAALMGQLRNALRAYALDGKDPAEAVNGLNLMLLDAGHEHMATMVFGILDPETALLRFVNAGHPPLLLAHADGTSRFLDGTSGVPLGASAHSRYRHADVVLAEGDTLLMFTDGLVEERSSSLDAGLRRFQQAVAEGPDDLDALCGHVVERSLAGTEGQDDVAILAVRLLPLGDHLHLRLPADPGILGPLRAALRRWLAPVATPEEIHDIVLACGEASTNAIRHGRGADGSGFEVEGDREGGVRISIRDSGRWKEPRTTIGGRGLHIIRSCVDDLDIVPSPTGTALHMRWRLGAASVRPALL